MQVIAKAAFAASLLCCIALGTAPAAAQAYYYYFGEPYNVWARLPHHRYYAPRPFFPYGAAYYGDPFCYPEVGVCCPRGFILQKRVCTPIGW